MDVISQLIVNCEILVKLCYASMLKKNLSDRQNASSKASLLYNLSRLDHIYFRKTNIFLY